MFECGILNSECGIEEANSRKSNPKIPHSAFSIPYSMNPLVSIISVNYNQTAVTCAMLDSIRRQDYQNIEVFVVDNASAESPEAVLNFKFPEVKFIRSARNLGFAGGNNLAVRQARGEYLFFINNDTELPDGCISRLLDLFLEVPNLGAVSPKILYFPENEGQTPIIQYVGTTAVNPLTARNSTIGWGETDLGQFTKASPTAYVHGAAMMVPRSVIDRAGMMAEDFFLYYEELDWSERIRRAGFDIWVEPRAHIFHKESLTVAKMGALKSYFLNRNRVWFMRRNFRGPRLAFFYLFLWLVTVPKNLFTFALRGEWANARAFFQGICWNFQRPAARLAPRNKFEKIECVSA